MRQAWVSFLSCDAREMCRPGPAFARVGLTWLAVLFRIATLLLMLTVDVGYWGERAKSDFYLRFGDSVSQAERATYDAIRADAGDVRAGWLSGRIDDAVARGEARRIVSAINEWTSEDETRRALFFRHGWHRQIVNVSDFIDSELAPCRPFVSLWGRQTGVLETEEVVDNVLFFCTYVWFVY